MNTLTFSAENEVVLNGFDDITDDAKITVKLIKSKIIICLGHLRTEAAHLHLNLDGRTIKDTNFIAIAQESAKEKPLTFIRTPSLSPEYIQFA